MKNLYSYQEIERTETGVCEYNISFSKDDDNFLKGYRVNLKDDSKTPIYGRDFNDKLLELVYFKRPTLELFVFYGHKSSDGIYGSWTKATKQDLENVTSTKVQLLPDYLSSEKPNTSTSILTKDKVNETDITNELVEVDRNINYDEIKLLKKVNDNKTTH